MAALHIDDSEFEHRILKANGTFLVDFWAEWCGPCRQISPILDEIANERAGRITIAKVNIDKNPGTPQKFGVRGIPTLIIFKDGQALSTKVGSLPKSKLVEWIDSVIGS